jgi:hypothetical protein
MCGRVGEHQLVFDLRTLLSIEGEARIEHEAILGPIDMRALLGGAVQGPGDSLLALGEGAVYRIVLDEVSRLSHLDVRTVFPVPAVLEPLTRRLSLVGVVELEEGHAFLVDPAGLARAYEASL